jgi:hypothetical protein
LSQVCVKELSAAAATDVRRNLTVADLLGLFTPSTHVYKVSFEFAELMFSSLKKEENLNRCENLETPASEKRKTA